MNLFDLVTALADGTDNPIKTSKSIKESQLWNDGTNDWSAGDQWHGGDQGDNWSNVGEGVGPEGLDGGTASPIPGNPGFNEDSLHVGDPIIVVGPNQFEGKTGEISEFSPSGKFVIVNLYNYGEHSMHLSDVEYNEYADRDEDEGVEESSYKLRSKGLATRRDRFKALREKSVEEATGDERFDDIMSRMEKEPKYPDVDMPPTSWPEVLQWPEATPSHKLFAKWAIKAGYTNVNDALLWFGDNVGPDYDWKPTGEYLDVAAKHDPEAAEWMRLFYAYDNIVMDWPAEYRLRDLEDADFTISIDQLPDLLNQLYSLDKDGDPEGTPKDKPKALPKDKPTEPPEDEVNESQTTYPNAEVIKSRNGKPVGEIYQDANGWGCYHYRLDDGASHMDSRDEAFDELRAFHDGREIREARRIAASRSTRASLAKLAKLNAMSPEERKAYDQKRAEQTRKRDDARIERERAEYARKQAAKKGVAEGLGMWGGGDDNKKSKTVSDLERSRNEKKQSADRARAEERDRAWWKAQDDAAKAGKDTFEFDGKTHPIKEEETDYSKRRQRERDIDAGKPVEPEDEDDGETDYSRRRAQQKKELELGESTNYWTKLQHEKNTRLNSLVNELKESIEKK